MSLPSLVLTLLAGLQGAGAAAEERTDESALGALTKVESWSDLLARDRRIAFGLRTRTTAVADLARTDINDERRGVALMALGAAREGSERPRIETWAQEGKSELRQAAILALGELQAGDIAPLIDFTTKKSEVIAESGLLALARFGTPAALAHVQGVAGDASSPLQAKARAVLAFVADPASTPDLAVARVLLELRFAAARAHGLVDGQSWDVLVLDALLDDAKFMNRVIYRSASDLRVPGIADCFLEIALERGPPERLRGVVNAIPSQLSELIESKLFTPLDEREWAALLTEIDERDLAAFTDPILRRAFEYTNLRAQATSLLARGGSAGSAQLSELGLQSEDPRERAAAASALGATAREEYLTLLGALEDDPSADVRAAALVAQLRLGSATALATLRKELGLDAGAAAKPKPDARWAPIVAALCEHARHVEARKLLAELSPYLPNQLRARASAALIEVGSSEPRAWLREFIRELAPRGALAAECVRALASGAPSLEDLALLRETFPVEDDLELNVELACALIELKDPEVLPVLRASLWNEPLNRSLLAGALWQAAAGIDSLRMEALHPPLGASPRDQRRVGLALGMWGGIETVEWLGARLNAGDPVVQGAVLGALGARTH